MEFRCEVCGALFESKRKLGGHRVGKHVKGPRLRNSTIKLQALSQIQIGYVAAFLDGEGGIQITETTRKDRVYTIALHPCVYFTNTNLEVLESIRRWLGAGCIVRRKDDRPGHKTTYSLNVTGMRNIAELLSLLRPCMIIKTRQADVMIRFCLSRMSHYMGKERRYTEEELSLYRALKELNKRGVKNNANAR